MWLQLKAGISPNKIIMENEGCLIDTVVQLFDELP